jgi:hypothetical protein
MSNKFNKNYKNLNPTTHHLAVLIGFSIGGISNPETIAWLVDEQVKVGNVKTLGIQDGDPTRRQLAQWIRKLIQDLERGKRT